MKTVRLLCLGVPQFIAFIILLQYHQSLCQRVMPRCSSRITWIDQVKPGSSKIFQKVLWLTLCSSSALPAMEVSVDTAFENQNVFMKVRKIWPAGFIEQVMSVKS